MASKKDQKQLTLHSVRAGKVKDIEMGVFDDHSVYLTARGLAAACGVAPSTIISWTKDWRRGSTSTRDRTVEAILDQLGWSGESLTKDVTVNGTKQTTHDEFVCMAVLEYYEHDASVGEQAQQIARHHRRAFSRAGLRIFVYQSLGVTLQEIVKDGVDHFTRRLLDNPSPAGYFFVQKASAELILDSARAGLSIGQHTVPDISIGRAWSTYWTENSLAEKFGERTTWEYKYPSGTPQSSANIEAYIYPNASRGHFDDWLQQEYLTGKYPNYLAGKLSAQGVERLLAAVKKPELPSNKAP